MALQIVLLLLIALQCMLGTSAACTTYGKTMATDETGWDTLPNSLPSCCCNALLLLQALLAVGMHHIVPPLLGAAAL